MTGTFGILKSLLHNSLHKCTWCHTTTFPPCPLTWLNLRCTSWEPSYRSSGDQKLFQDSKWQAFLPAVTIAKPNQLESPWWTDSDLSLRMASSQIPFPICVLSDIPVVLLQPCRSNKPSKYLAFTVPCITEAANDIFIGEQWEAAGWQPYFSCKRQQTPRRLKRSCHGLKYLRAHSTRAGQSNPRAESKDIYTASSMRAACKIKVLVCTRKEA